MAHPRRPLVCESLESRIHLSAVFSALPSPLAIDSSTSSQFLSTYVIPATLSSNSANTGNDAQAASPLLTNNASSASFLLAPSAVTHTTLSKITPTSATLSWLSPTSTLSGFNIYRATGNTSPILLASVGPTVTSWTDLSLSPTVTYFYSIGSWNAAGETIAPPVALTTPATSLSGAGNTGFMLAPISATGITASNITATSATLTWLNASPALGGFNVYRATGGGAPVFVASVGPTTTSWTDTSLAPASTYSYSIGSWNTAGETVTPPVTVKTAPASTGGISLPVIGDVGAQRFALAPTSVTQTLLSSFTASSATLSWNSASSTLSGFNIYRSTGGGSPVLVASVASSVTSWTDTSLVPATAYSYSIGSWNVAGETIAPPIAVVTSAASPTGGLLPGTGFTGPTAQPATIGTGTAATTEAIARWDVVPFQTFTSSFNVGVVAFNTTGIDHVSFSVNGGAWLNVSQMTLNPQTNVAEYWCTLNAADFADGAVEIRAIAYPVVGIPRVLAGPTVNDSNGDNSLILYANGHGTLQQTNLYVSTIGNDATGDGSFQNPFASLAHAVQASQSGSIVYLEAGTYTFTPPSTQVTNDRWITITAAPGVSQSAVILKPNEASLAINHLAISNVSIDCTLGFDFFGWTPPFWTDTELWIDNCSISSSLGEAHTPEINPAIDSGWTAAYVTNTSIHDYPGRAIGTTNVDIVRNVEITNIADDAIDNPQLVVNTTIGGIVAGNPEDHIDAIQYFPDHSDMNSIVFNVKATGIDGQLIFGGLLAQNEGGPTNGVFSNIAVVNFLGTTLQGPDASSAASQISANGAQDNNLLFENITLPNQSLYFVGDLSGSNFANTLVTNSVLWRLYVPGVGSALTITASHIIDFANEQADLPVGDFTIGNPGFVSAPQPDGTYSSTGDFDLLPTSILMNRVAIPLVPVDLDNVLRTSPDSIGAYAD